MKSILIAILAILSFSTLAADKPIRITRIESNGVYIPKGYDSNDNIELIASGILPNLCYKNPHTEYKIEGKKINISLQAWTSDNGMVFCAEMVVPFIHTFAIGVLDRGNYEIFINEEKTGELFVEESSSSAIDDVIYANVEAIEKVVGENRVIIHGHNPSECLQFDEFKVFHNNKDVYSVLPVMKQVQEFCPMKMVPFKLSLEISDELKESPVLLHVRSMNGKSVNALVAPEY